MTTSINTTKIERPAIIAPPKEFFRNFANLHHTRVLSEDFPHEKLLTIKYKGTAQNFIVNAKGSLTFRRQAVKGETDRFEEVPATSGEVKLLTNWQGKNVEAKFNNKGLMRFWANLGNYNVVKPLEFVTVLKSDTAFNRVKAYVLAGYHGPNTDAIGRLQINHTGAGNTRFSFADKIYFRQGDFFGGLYGNFDFANLRLNQYNALLGYNINKKVHVYAEHITVPTTPKEQFTYRLGTVALTGVYKDDKYWGLAQVNYNATNQNADFVGGIVYTVDKNTSLRAKITHSADLTFGARYRVNNNLSINLGTFATLKTPEKIVDKTKTVPIPFGVQLEFSF